MCSFMYFAPIEPRRRRPTGHHVRPNFSRAFARSAARISTAHRRTGQNDLISAAEQLLCLFKANEYAVRVLCEHLRYLAGQRVDLKQNSRNAELLCCAYHRKRRIAAAADHAVRLGLFQQLLRLADRRDSQLCRLQIVQNALRLIERDMPMISMVSSGYPSRGTSLFSMPRAEPAKRTVVCGCFFSK